MKLRFTFTHKERIINLLNHKIKELINRVSIMSNYVYVKPKGVLHKVSIRKWNKQFRKEGLWPFVVAEVYLQDDCAEVHYVNSKIGLVTVLMLSPLLLIIGTLQCGIKETLHDLKRTVFLKKYGTFSSDIVYRGQKESWDKLMELL